MRDAALALLAVLLIVGVPVGVAADAGSPSASLTVERPSAADGEPTSRTAVQSSVTSLGTEFTITLRQNGDAHWNVTTRYRLADDADRAAFEAFAERYVNNETDAGPQIDVWRNGARLASDATGREMRVSNVDRDAAVVNGVGQLTLTFRWSQFARPIDRDRFVVGDAFRSPSGTWFPTLDEGQRLVIELPSGSGIIDIDSPGVSVSNLRLTLESGVSPGQFNATYRLDVTPTVSPTPTPTPTPLSPTPAVPGLPTEAIGIGAFAVLLLAVVYALFGGGGLPFGASTTDDEPPAPPEPTDESVTERTDESTAERTDEQVTERTDEQETERTDEQEIDPALLSDEERVERLLTRNGGRMRQADIVDETGWSDAKVSQLLSSMADEDRVDKLRIGRENLISLPGENGFDDPDDPPNDTR